MEVSAEKKRGCVVRAGDSYQGKQGPTYTPGISAATVRFRALWLGDLAAMRRQNQGPGPRSPRVRLLACTRRKS